MRDPLERQRTKNRHLSRRALIRVSALLAATPLIGGCERPLMFQKASEERVTVEIPEREVHRFEPSSVTIERGTSIVWLNGSRLSHTVTGDPELVSNPDNVILPEGASPWDSGDLLPGRHWAYRFDTPGTYIYVCRYHEDAGMIGMITVE